MTFSLFSIAILLIFFSVTAAEVYQSVKRGFRMTLVSLAIVIFSVFLAGSLAYLISEVVSNAAMHFISNNFIEFRQFLINYSWASVFVDAVMGMILGSVLFVPVFFATRAITNIIVSIVWGIMVKRIPGMPPYYKEKDSYFDQNDKVLSVVTGVIISFVVTMVITSPIMGTLDVANKVLGITSGLNVGNAQSMMENVDEEEISVYSNDFCGNVFYQLGGNLMYYSAASADVYGEKVHLISEVDALEDVFDDLQYTYSALIDPQSATDEQINRMYSLCDNIERLELCSGPLGAFVTNFSVAWQNGETFFGIPKPVTNNLIEPAFDEVLSVCQNTDYRSANANMVTLLKLYAAVMESKVFEVDISNFNLLMEFVNESEVVGKLDAILAENPYMSGISLSSIAMAAVSQYIREIDDPEKYSVLMDDIADAINRINERGYATDEEKAKVLASQAREYIEEYGIDVPEDIAESVAEEMLKHLDEKSVTRDDVDRIFSEYLH